MAQANLVVLLLNEWCSRRQRERLFKIWNKGGSKEEYVLTDEETDIMGEKCICDNSGKLACN